jgi:hypothetical protein
MGQGVQKGLEVLFGHVQSDHRFLGAFASLCSSRAASLFLLFDLLCLLRLWMTPVVMWAKWQSTLRVNECGGDVHHSDGNGRVRSDRGGGDGNARRAGQVLLRPALQAHGDAHGAGHGRLSCARVCAHARARHGGASGRGLP